MSTNNDTIGTDQAIDPATGMHYLFWDNGHALMAEVADDMLSLRPDTTRPTTGLTNFTEASFSGSPRAILRLHLLPRR